MHNESRRCLETYAHSRPAHCQWSRLMDGVMNGRTGDSRTSPAGGPNVCNRPAVDNAILRLLDSNVELLEKIEADEAAQIYQETLPDGSSFQCSNEYNQIVHSDCNKEIEDDALRTTTDNGYVHSPSVGLTVCEQNREHFDADRRNPYGEAAWKSPNVIYDSGLQGLNEEMWDFYRYIRPTAEEQAMRRDVVDRLIQLVLELWPNTQVEVFGSFDTNLYLPTSDIDLVVLCSWETNPQNALTQLEDELNKQGIYDDVKLIKSSVPIVKFVDRETAVKVDVGWNVRTGIQSARFIKEKILEYPQLPLLVVVLKQCLLFNNLLESFNGGISSYCLILLVVSYLQLNPADRQRNNAAYMLVKFLELYGVTFNYTKTGIRIRDGGSYFNKDENTSEISRYSLLCIEDPLNRANDVGQGSYGVLGVRDVFHAAFKKLRDACLPQFACAQPPSSLTPSSLSRILLVPHEICQYRRLMKHKQLMKQQQQRLLHEQQLQQQLSVAAETMVDVKPPMVDVDTPGLLAVTTGRGVAVTSADIPDRNRTEKIEVVENMGSLLTTVKPRTAQLEEEQEEEVINSNSISRDLGGVPAVNDIDVHSGSKKAVHAVHSGFVSRNPAVPASVSLGETNPSSAESLYPAAANVVKQNSEGGTSCGTGSVSGGVTGAASPKVQVPPTVSNCWMSFNTSSINGTPGTPSPGLSTVPSAAMTTRSETVTSYSSSVTSVAQSGTDVTASGAATASATYRSRSVAGATENTNYGSGGSGNMIRGGTYHNSNRAGGGAAATGGAAGGGSAYNRGSTSLATSQPSSVKNSSHTSSTTASSGTAPSSRNKRSRYVGRSSADGTSSGNANNSGSTNGNTGSGR